MKKRIFTIFGLLLFCSPLILFAQDSTQNSAPDYTQRKRELLSKLSQLREQNPEAFHQIVSQHLENERAQFQQLREQNPQEFERRISERKAQFSRRSQWLQENHPEEYNDFKQRMQEKQQSRFFENKQRPWRRMNAENASTPQFANNVQNQQNHNFRSTPPGTWRGKAWKKKNVNAQDNTADQNQRPRGWFRGWGNETRRP